MIRYNFTICSYCFFVYAFDDIGIYLLAGSYTLHSRKFPTKPSVYTYKFIFLIRYRFSSKFSFSFPNFLLFCPWFSGLIPLTSCSHRFLHHCYIRLFQLIRVFLPQSPPAIKSAQTILRFLSIFEYIYSQFVM